MPYLNAGLSSVIKIQKTPDSIYHASYPCRFFVEKELIRTFNAEGYDLISLFPSLEKLDDSATWKGHIYYKRQAQ
jgi:hypothetical protein